MQTTDPDTYVPRALDLSREGLLKRYVVASLEKRPRRTGRIEVLPWQLFLDQLWAGELG